MAFNQCLYFEGFQFANVANAGPNFTLASGTNQRVVSNVLEGNSTGTSAGYYRYSGSGTSVGLMPGDNVAVTVQIAAPPDGTTSPAGVSNELHLRCPATFSTTGAAGTYAFFSFLMNGNWFIGSVVSGTSYTTQASGTAAGFTNGDFVTFRAVGNVYTAYRNGILISGATWTDGGGVVGSSVTTPTKRKWGLMMQCLATDQQGPVFDSVAAYDLGNRGLVVAPQPVWRPSQL